jgi:hypothetical protein
METSVDVSLFQASQSSQIDTIRFIAPWGLQQHGRPAKRRVIEQKAKRLQTQFSFANVLMPVHAAAQTFLGIVEMKDLALDQSTMASNW